MNLQTKVNLSGPTEKFSHKSKFLCLGSCFAAEIGSRLETRLFDCLTNPLGNIFNPLVLSELLARALENRPFKAEEFFEHQEIWRHFLIHSSLAKTDRQLSVKSANNALACLREKLIHCDLLILSLGTASVYQKIGYAGAIGHNHRLPLSAFDKRRLNPDDIANSLDSILNQIHQANPSLKTCITVSPVRHSRDGLHENNLSKSSLLLAVDQLRKSNNDWDYFPAYEILIDELRDYRFYAEDLVHPSAQAVSYIWECFRDGYISQESIPLINEIESVLKLLNHRTHHTDTDQHKNHKAAVLKRIQTLEKALPQASQLKEASKRYDEK